MTKETKTLDNVKFQEIYTNEKFRNEVAYAHSQSDKNGTRRITCSYPITYIVTDEQIEKANTERLRAKAETLANLGNKLVFVGMGAKYDTNEFDDIGNFRIRTEFTNKNGNRFFIEFGQDCRRGRQSEEKIKVGRIDHAIDRTKQDLLQDAHSRQSEFYNYKGLERETPLFNYTKNSILKLINKYFDCNFYEMEIDNYNLSPQDFVCKSPHYIPVKGIKNLRVSG